MVSDAGPQAARPQGAAHVDVEASSKLDFTESSDVHQFCFGTKED
jgi:hypothetical protein